MATASTIGKVVVTHAPAGAWPPDEMCEHLMAGRNATIMWVHDHGWQGWQMIDRPLYCCQCGDELQIHRGSGKPMWGTSALSHYDYECPTCGDVYF
jgi:hypothetical protein